MFRMNRPTGVTVIAVLYFIGAALLTCAGLLLVAASGFAAAAIAVIPFIARPVLDATVQQLDTASLGAAVGSFFAALALFYLLGSSLFGND